MERPDGAAEELLRRARTIRAEIAGIGSVLGAIARSTRERVDVSRRVRERPARTLLTAAAAGYVAGGGFFTPTTGTLVRVGFRLWLIPLLRRQLLHSREYEE